MKITYLKSKTLLEKAGIYKFAREISNLAAACFSSRPKDDFSDTLLTYILNGGIHGGFESNAVINKKRHMSFRYMIKKVFIPVRRLAKEYPVLKKHKILVPFCWMHRTVKQFFRMIKNSFKRKKSSKNISDENALRVRKRLGI